MPHLLLERKESQTNMTPEQLAKIDERASGFPNTNKWPDDPVDIIGLVKMLARDRDDLLSYVHDLQHRLETRRFEVEVLRGIDCEKDGDGPCGACLKCMKRKGRVDALEEFACLGLKEAGAYENTSEQLTNLKHFDEAERVKLQALALRTFTRALLKAAQTF